MLVWLTGDIIIYTFSTCLTFSTTFLSSQRIYNLHLPITQNKGTEQQIFFVSMLTLFCHQKKKTQRFYHKLNEKFSCVCWPILKHTVKLYFDDYRNVGSICAPNFAYVSSSFFRCKKFWIRDENSNVWIIYFVLFQFSFQFKFIGDYYVFWNILSLSFSPSLIVVVLICFVVAVVYSKW